MRAQVGRDGMLVMGAFRVRAALGRGGVRGDKLEGDGATPAGMLPLRRVLYPGRPAGAATGGCAGGAVGAA